MNYGCRNIGGEEEGSKAAQSSSGTGSVVTSLRAAYSMQFLIRVDAGRQQIIYDLYEFVPELLTCYNKPSRCVGRRRSSTTHSIQVLFRGGLLFQCCAPSLLLSLGALSTEVGRRRTTAEPLHFAVLALYRLKKGRSAPK